MEQININWQYSPTEEQKATAERSKNNLKWMIYSSVVVYFLIFWVLSGWKFEDVDKTLFYMFTLAYIFQVVAFNKFIAPKVGVFNFNYRANAQGVTIENVDTGKIDSFTWDSLFSVSFDARAL